MAKSPQPSAADMRRVRQIRLVAIVMSATMIIRIALQYIGGQMGWAPRIAFLFDLAAIAALVWALVVAYWGWKQGRNS